jgi:hypothetical protein
VKRTRIYRIGDIRNETDRKEFAEWLDKLASSDAFSEASVTLKLEVVHDSPRAKDLATEKD